MAFIWVICGAMVTFGALLIIRGPTVAKEEASWSEAESAKKLTGMNFAVIGLLFFLLAFVMSRVAEIIVAWIH